MDYLIEQDIIEHTNKIFEKIELLGIESKVSTINKIRLMLHEYSPFKGEPVDCVQWVKSTNIEANDYNPNVVAPPEMKLLKHSISSDGYTQPIVAWETTENRFEVIDGFHRNRVGTESKSINKRIFDYLPLSIIKKDREGKNDRVASTIRHNRARGKHTVDGMSEIVIDLKRRNWSDEKISNELGMDQDEVLRLAQISGLAEMFTDKEFSESWEAVDTNEINEEDDINITKEIANGNTT